MTVVSHFKGDNKTLKVTVTDSAGTSVDLTSYSFKFSVKKDPKLDDSYVIFMKSSSYSTEIEVSSTETGVIRIFIEPSDCENAEAGMYYYDVQMTTDTSKIYTIAMDTFVIKEDVTKT